VQINFVNAFLTALVLTSCANITSHRAVGQPVTTISTAISAQQPVNGPLWISDGGGFVASAGIVSPDVPCASIILTLQRDPAPIQSPDPKLTGTPFPCRKRSLYIGYLRSTLFIEGLDRDGRRLFVATGDNPLHQDIESPSSPNGQMSWHSTDTTPSIVSTFIQAPITPTLTRLRWYDVDANEQPHLMGEMLWRNVQRLPQ